MIADSVEELHSFAESIGVARHWFHKDHYDLKEADWKRAIDCGATLVNSRTLVLLKRK